MKLKDLLKKQTLKTTKREVTIETEDGKHTADVYIKVLSCGDVMDPGVKTTKDALYNNVSKSIVDEKGDQIFTIEQIAELPTYIWFQLLDLSNEVNDVTGKSKP